VPASTGASARCVPQVWGDPAAAHSWWNVDVPVNGEWTISDATCSIAEGRAVAGGVIRSSSDRLRNAIVTVAFLDAGGTTLGTGEFAARDLAPGAVQRWEIAFDPGSGDVDDCRVAGVRYGS